MTSIVDGARRRDGLKTVDLDATKRLSIDAQHRPESRGGNFALDPEDPSLRSR
jgi:hypothetical protein